MEPALGQYIERDASSPWVGKDRVDRADGRAAGERLAFNGWWQSSYLPSSLDEDRLEWMLSSKEGRSGITGAQAQRVGELLEDPAWKGRTDAVACRLRELCNQFEDEIIEACGPEVLLRRLVHRS